MFFMYLFYLAVILGLIWALYKYVVQPIIDDKELQEEVEKEKEDEARAERIAKKAELVGDDITSDLHERVILLEELSAQLVALRQTVIVAERVANIKHQIKSLNEAIMTADEATLDGDDTLDLTEDDGECCGEENCDCHKEATDEIPVEDVPVDGPVAKPDSDKPKKIASAKK